MILLIEYVEIGYHSCNVKLYTLPPTTRLSALIRDRLNNSGMLLHEQRDKEGYISHLIGHIDTDVYLSRFTSLSENQMCSTIREHIRNHNLESILS
jgi:hypothetical protein